MERPANIRTHNRDRLYKSRAARRILIVAGAGYAVVGLFAFVYSIVRSGWPDLAQVSSVTIAALAAAPLALALLWDRLSGFKGFGFEVTLTTVSARMEIEVPDALGVFSGDPPSAMTPDDLEAIERVIQATVEAGQELLELNLRDGNYWWSTRLFLLAALAEEYSRIQQLLFVDQEAERIFVGMAPPSDVRQALANRWPTLELSYQEIRAQVRSLPRTSQPSHIVLGWSLHTFESESQNRVDERNLRVKVNGPLLREWLFAIERQLTAGSVDWDGITDPSLIRSLLFQFHSPYIALLRHGRLDRVVNRLDLALKVAERALE